MPTPPPKKKMVTDALIDNSYKLNGMISSFVMKFICIAYFLSCKYNIRYSTEMKLNLVSLHYQKISITV